MGRPYGGEARGWYVSQAEEGVGSSGLPVPPRNTGLYATDTAWGDFDGDRDLDYVVTGTLDSSGAAWTGWYENFLTQYGEPNEDPAPPHSSREGARG